MNFKRNDELPLYTVKAENYAFQSDNKIHSSDVAQKLGFTGGLVPGVGIYTYMSQPLITGLGSDWLSGGFMNAKFLNPIYDKEQMTVQTRVKTVEPLTIEIEVHNSEGKLCAVGTAGFKSPDSAPTLADYPSIPLPELNDRFPANANALEIDCRVGTIPVEYHPEDNQVYFFEKSRDLFSELRSPEQMHHPGLFLHIANRLTHYNIKLGPWIHTASDVQHYNLPVMSEEIQLSGKILDAYERRGHHYVVLDLAAISESSKPIARIKHTAIIKPKGV